MSIELTALFGGTFDPIHYGHLLPVIALAKEVNLTHVSLLPNYIPPHKPQPVATTEQRLDMLRLAISDYPLFSIDCREITQAKSERPSFTIETLQSWRQEHGNEKNLAFIIGQDSLLNLPSWYNWQKLLDYCHLLVCQRPGYSQQINDPQLKQWLKTHQTESVDDLHQNPNGFIYVAHTPLKNISATEIKQRIQHRQDCQAFLPPKVWQYIQNHHLYNA
ncbi:nicotinate-nucleotide adenylyltransferase [Frischella perrara]|uniref:nicotinate-nucleotide adenylyltransferase n=1 Tax=Frischella perrara TaxID=1267021 RepID=UPI0023F3E7B5|nr:nicotinate-nucleotide adenylyltransferase [Frischella perrara]